MWFISVGIVAFVWGDIAWVYHLCLVSAYDRTTGHHSIPSYQSRRASLGLVREEGRRWSDELKTDRDWNGRRQIKTASVYRWTHPWPPLSPCCLPLLEIPSLPV